MTNNQFSMRGWKLTEWCVALTLLTAALPDTHSAVPVQFGSPTNWPAGNSPGVLVTGDFNNDRIPDVAVLGGSGLITLLGNGIGGLGAPATNRFSVFGPGGMATGDFNKDGNLDVVEVDWYSMRVFLGNGAGNLTLLTNVSGDNYYSTYPAAVAVGDLNGDTNPDIAVVNTGNPSGRGLALGFGLGNGLFSGPTNFFLPQTPADLALGDVNGDGLLDTAVAFNYPFGGVPTNVCILTNRGNGTMAIAQFYQAPTLTPDSHYSVRLVDLDRKGGLDLAVMNLSARAVSIRFNDGNGNFGPATNYFTEFQPTSMVAGDFNGDDKIDLVIRSSSAARVLTGDGNGAFTVGALMMVQSGVSSPGTVAAGDFDTNGTPDLVLSCFDQQFVTIRLNRTPPEMQIRRMAVGNQITWPASYGTGFNLWIATNIDGGWEPFPTPPGQSGNEKTVTDNTAAERKFYRLFRVP